MRLLHSNACSRTHKHSDRILLLLLCLLCIANSFDVSSFHVSLRTYSRKVFSMKLVALCGVICIYIFLLFSKKKRFFSHQWRARVIWLTQRSFAIYVSNTNYLRAGEVDFSLIIMIKLIIIFAEILLTQSIYPIQVPVIIIKTGYWKCL